MKQPNDFRMWMVVIFSVLWLSLLYVRECWRGNIPSSTPQIKWEQSRKEVVISIWKVQLKVLMGRQLLLWCRGMHIDGLHVACKMVCNFKAFKDLNAKVFMLPKVQCLCWADLQEEIFNSLLHNISRKCQCSVIPQSHPGMPLERL